MAEGRDKRTSERRRTLFGGVIYAENGDTWTCFINDVSEAGARVRAKTDLEAESFVDLKITKFHDIRRCKVMWNRDGHLGLQFVVKIDKTKRDMVEFFKLMKGPGASS